MGSADSKRSAEENSFFNQPAATAQEKKQLTKDSILALYSSVPASGTPPAQVSAPQSFGGNKLYLNSTCLEFMLVPVSALHKSFSSSLPSTKYIWFWLSFGSRYGNELSNVQWDDDGAANAFSYQWHSSKFVLGQPHFHCLHVVFNVRLKSQCAWFSILI